MRPLDSIDVGRRRVRVVDGETGDALAGGVLMALSPEAVEVSVDTWHGVDADGPLGDGPSFAHDVVPLEEELRVAERHPEYGIDVDAVSAALVEARADEIRKDAGT